MDKNVYEAGRKFLQYQIDYIQTTFVYSCYTVCNHPLPYHTKQQVEEVEYMLKLIMEKKALLKQWNTSFIDTLSVEN